jgi:uroporphyrinogen-III synthase
VTRVAVTTSADRSDHAADAYRRRGLTPVLLPCIRVEPGSDSVIELLRRAAVDADWIVVTSARAIETTWPEASMPATTVAAVGEATARAVVNAGGTVSLVGTVGASDLVDRIGRGSGRIVVPHAAGADAGVRARLVDAGWEVVDGIVYRTVPTGPASDPVDAAAFASPSAVDGWLGARDLEGVVVGAIGPTTAAALTQRGREPDVVAERPSHASLAAALAGRLRGKITA